MIPSLLIQAGSVHRLNSVCLWDHDQISGDTNHFFEQVTSKNILDPNAHFFCEDRTSCYRAWYPPLRYALTWPCQGLKNVCE